MDQEWGLCHFSDSVDAENVIKMRVRRDNTCYRDVEIFDEPQDSFRLVARIDD